MKKKFLCIALCLLMLVPLMVSCGPDGNETVSKPQVDVSDTTSEEVGLPLPEKRFDTTIKILCLPASRHKYAELQFVPNDEDNGDVINDAVAQRNNLIEQLYGIKIEVVADSDPYTALKATLSGGDDEYQIICNSVNNMLPHAVENIFLSLNDELLIDQDYWDKGAIDNLRMDDNLYFLAGDALICDDEYTYCVLYNKDLYNNTPECAGAYGDIYQLVEDKKWDYDAMYTMAKAVTQPDSDGNYMTTNCTYGLLSEGYATNMIVAGSGSTSFVRTADGKFQFNMDSEESYTAFNKVFEMATDKTATIKVDDFSSEGWANIRDMFNSNKGLFYTTHLASISSSIQDVNYGVLPMPLARVGQDNYYSGINIYQCEVMAIPARNVGAKHEATIYLLEALGYWSKHTPGQSTVTEAYYETTLKLKKLDDEADEKMLDLVCKNRLYDIGYIFNWGGVLNVWASTIRSGTNSAASNMASVKDAAEQAMETTMQEYAEIIS